MTKLFFDLTKRIVLAWVRLYSTAIPSGIRDARREEIQSDLWEQESDAIIDGSGQGSVITQVLARLPCGVPSDLAWRLQAVREVGPAKIAIGDTACKGHVYQWVFLGLGALLAAISFVGGTSVSFGYLVTMNQADPDWATAVLLLDGFAILVGLRLVHKSPVIGVCNVMVAATVFSLAWYWATLVPSELILCCLEHQKGRVIHSGPFQID